MKLPRASGILLHPTSLPNEFGIGDFGSSAYKFVDLLKESKQRYWQMLPLGPTGFGDSPYQCFSAFAGNTNLISPELLVKDGLLSQSDVVEGKPVFPASKVDFGKVIKWKSVLLRGAFEQFQKKPSLELRTEFEEFCNEAGSWLENYALFRAIKETQGQSLWLKWDKPLRLRDESAVRVATDELAEECLARKFFQFLFFKQWKSLKNYANKNGIAIVGDIPIFVSMDSSDVWCNRSDFKLNDDGTPKVVSGVPPDFFSKTGQLWGNPIYDWDRMMASGFDWWKQRFKETFSMFDVLRIDHFRGFSACWEVPGEDETAENGEWVAVPGRDLFNALRYEFGSLPVIAEDLGDITPDVEELLGDFGFPGMRVLQFAFGGDSNSRDLPHNFVRNCVAYSGTHDNDTTVSWFDAESEANADREPLEFQRERDFCRDYLRSDGDEINWDFICALWASVADTAIVPFQDLAGLGNEARMNLPATASSNWQWRIKEGSWNAEAFERLGRITELYGRITDDE